MNEVYGNKFDSVRVFQFIIHYGLQNCYRCPCLVVGKSKKKNKKKIEQIEKSSN